MQCAQECLTFRMVSLQGDDHVATCGNMGPPWSSNARKRRSLRSPEVSSAFSSLSLEVCHISMWCGSCTPSQMLPAKAASL